MAACLQLERFSIGVGARFGGQAQAQARLRACLWAAHAGAEVIPVWNKSHREHQIIGSEPRGARAAADAAVNALGWQDEWCAPYASVISIEKVHV